MLSVNLNIINPNITVQQKERGEFVIISNVKGYFMKNCIHCVDFQPKWKQLQELLRTNNIKTTSLIVDDQPQEVGKDNVSMFPTVKVFLTDTFTKRIYDYNVDITDYRYMYIMILSILSAKKAIIGGYLKATYTEIQAIKTNFTDLCKSLHLDYIHDVTNTTRNLRNPISNPIDNDINSIITNYSLVQDEYPVRIQDHNIMQVRNISRYETDDQDTQSTKSRPVFNYTNVPVSYGSTPIYELTLDNKPYIDNTVGHNYYLNTYKCHENDMSFKLDYYKAKTIYQQQHNMN